MLIVALEDVKKKVPFNLFFSLFGSVRGVWLAALAGFGDVAIFLTEVSLSANSHKPFVHFQQKHESTVLGRLVLDIAGDIERESISSLSWGIEDRVPENCR